MPKEIRKSGLINYEAPNLYNSVGALSDNISYESFKEEYNLLAHRLKPKIKCYIVKGNDPSLFYISFSKDKKPARSEAAKYIIKNTKVIYHWKELASLYLSLRAYRHKDFDKYADDNKIPIIEQLKIGITYTCALCNNKHAFTYEDYKDNKCYVVEDNFSINPYTKGYLICNSCFHSVKYN